MNSNITNQQSYENEYSLNEIIINVSNEPTKTDYYKKMFEKMTEKKKEEIVLVTNNYFSKCTE